MRERYGALSERWEPVGESFESDDDLFGVRLPTLLLDNKSDRRGDPEDDLEVFRELTDRALAVSAATGHGLGELGSFLFRNQRIVYVHTQDARSFPGSPAPTLLVGIGVSVANYSWMIASDTL